MHRKSLAWRIVQVIVALGPCPLLPAVRFHATPLAVAMSKSFRDQAYVYKQRSGREYGRGLYACKCHQAMIERHEGEENQNFTIKNMCYISWELCKKQTAVVTNRMSSLLGGY